MTLITNPLTPASWQKEKAFQAFSNKNYKQAISIYAEVFLEKQHQFGYLRDIAAALSELKQDEEARFLRQQADLLEKKLKVEGIIRDVRLDDSFSDADTWIRRSQEIEQNGLPPKWGFEQLIATIRRLAREYARD